MENPFKGIQNRNNVPRTLKKRVLDDITMIKSTFEFNNFILKKFPSTITNFMEK